MAAKRSCRARTLQRMADFAIFDAFGDDDDDDDDDLLIDAEEGSVLWRKSEVRSLTVKSS